MTDEAIRELLDEAYNDALKAYNSIKDYKIEIGVISSNSNRKKQTIDITNAELMYIHEHGSPLRNLPARPVLQLTLAYTIKTLFPETLRRIDNGCFKQHWSKADVRYELEKMCIRMQNYARDIIYRSDLLAPNSPSTIKRKKSDRPLLNTGQLARSITCRLVEINNSG